MSRPTIRDLRAQLILWANRVPVGSEWRHYQGDYYEVVSHGVDEETGEVEIAYREAHLGERPLELYCVGSLVPVNMDVVFHRKASLWETDVTTCRGNLLPQSVIDAMTPEEKLTAANEKIVVPRYVRVERVETFVELRRYG